MQLPVLSAVLLNFQFTILMRGNTSGQGWDRICRILEINSAYLCEYIISKQIIV